MHAGVYNQLAKSLLVVNYSVHYSIHCVFLQHPYHPLAIYQVSALTDNH